MTATTHTGRLARAPVIYVLAQVRFTAITTIEKYIPNIQERLRGEYPRYQHIETREVIIPMGAGGQAAQIVMNPRWDFNDKANRAGFLVQQDSIVYHTTAYTTFDDFLERFRIGLQVLNDELKISLTTRVGLRYIDLIVPDNSENMSQYVAGGLTGFPLENITGDPGQQQAVAVTKSSLGSLVLRFTQDQTEVTLPPDLANHTLTPAREHPIGTAKAILDTDHYSQLDGIDFSVEDVESRIKRLHEISSQAFKLIVTDYAWNKWR